MKLFVIISLFYILTPFLSNSQTYNWVVKHYNADEHEEFNNITKVNDTICYIFSNELSTNRLYKTTDQGRSWFLIYEKEHLDYVNLHLKDTVWNLGECTVIDDSCFFLSYYDSDVIDITKDGGKTFKRIQLKGRYDVVANLKMYDKNLGVAITDAKIAVTRDGWDTHEIFVFDTLLFTDHFYFLDKNNIAIHKFRLGGSLTLLNFNLWSGDIYTLQEDGYPNDSSWQDTFRYFTFIDKENGFAAGARLTSPKPGAYAYYQLFFKTTNGGRSWLKIYESEEPTSTTYGAIAFENELHGLGCQNGKWGETFDGGKTWERGYVQDNFGPGLASNMIWLGETAIYAERKIYRFEEVNEVVDNFYFERVDSTIYCYNSDSVMLRTLIEPRNFISESNNVFIGEGVDYVTFNGSESDPLSDFYFFPDRVDTTEVEIINRFTNIGLYAPPIHTRDTVFKIKIHKVENGNPVIYNRNDTLFTQLDTVSWHRASDNYLYHRGPSFKPVHKVNYIARYLDKNGCEFVSEPFKFTETNVEEILNKNDFEFYNDKLIISSELLNEIIEIEIFDVTGTLIEKFSPSEIISLENYSSGVYFIVLKTNNNANAYKFLKQ